MFRTKSIYLEPTKDAFLMAPCDKLTNKLRFRSGVTACD